MDAVDYQNIEKIINHLVLQDQFLHSSLRQLAEEEIKQLVFR